MRIITWNCNMAFRKKAEAILQYKPDILVVPECEHPDKLKFDDDTLKPTDVLWFGSNQSKGLGIFSYCDSRLKVLRCHKPEFRWVVPVAVKGKQFNFTIYAIWAYNPTDPDGCYVTQVWKAIHQYNRMLGRKNTIMAGDFNSNTIWDKPRRVGNHSAVVARLERKGIRSAYHSHFKQLQGKEEHPTLYMYRHKDKPYHIDYCFVSQDMLDKLQSVEIGEYEYWRKYSDHVPVIATFDIDC